MRQELWERLSATERAHLEDLVSEVGRIEMLEAAVRGHQSRAKAWKIRAQAAEETAEAQGRQLASLHRQIDLLSHVLAAHAAEDDVTEHGPPPEAPALEEEAEVVEEAPSEAQEEEEQQQQKQEPLKRSPAPAAHSDVGKLLKKLKSTLSGSDRRGEGESRGRRRRSLIGRARAKGSLSYAPPVPAEEAPEAASPVDALTVPEELLALAEADVQEPEVPRSKLVARVTLTSEDNFFVGFSEDIGEGGVFVASWDPPPVGARVELRVELPDDGIVAAVGEVGWHRLDQSGKPDGCGVRFLELDDGARLELTELIDAIGREPMVRED